MHHTVRNGSAHIASLFLLVALLFGAAAGGDPRRNTVTSASQGFANRGTLLHGRRLTEGPSLRFLPGRQLHYGTEELVGLLERVGRSLQRRFHLRLTVGDLSARNGGPVGHHASHQSGRDADVAFFVRDTAGRAALLSDYIAFNAQGTSIDGRYVFDTARNWALIESLMTDRAVQIDRVFVSWPLRTRLVDFARRHGASASLIQRVQLTLMQPTRAAPHDNHFHVRIACPSGDAQCRAGVHMTRETRIAQRARLRRRQQRQHRAH